MPQHDAVETGEFTGTWTAVCSFSQQRLWFLDQLEPGSTVYNLASALRLSGPLDRPALERSFREVVRRHEVLRTTFAVEDGSPVQVVHGDLTAELGFEDLDRVPEEAVRRRTVREANEPFDLRRGPLIRGRLLRLGAEDHVVLLSMHHIISDGWSMGVLIREVSLLYGAFSQGRPSPLAELPVQYADYAHWQREWLSGERLAKQVAYWKDRLGGLAPVLPLPTDRPRPAVPAHRGAAEPVVLSEEVSEGLRRLSRHAGGTLYMALLAGFAALLGRSAGEEDVVMGSPTAGRMRSELEGLIGFFANTLVMRTDLSGNPTVEELLGRVREGTLGAYAHQELPFERLVEELQPERSLSHHPLFQVLFILQNTPEEGLDLPGLSIRPLADDSSVSKLDLLLSMHEAGGRVRGTLEYDSELFERATIRRMLGHLEALLAGMAADPKSRPMALPLLSGAERHQMLAEWNATEVEVPLACVHELIAGQAARRPEEAAVAYDGAGLSYGELDRRARRLACRLRALGVGPEVRVALCAERSLDLVVGLLGILRAGGAYVPVDPEYPRDRVAWMLADCGAPVVLTQQRLLSRLPAVGATVVCLDGEPSPEAHPEDVEGAEAGWSGAEAESLAYVIYTSGSTGRPKGVQVRHRSLTCFVTDMARRLGIGAEDRLLSVTSLSFDIFGLELFVPLVCGAQVLLASRDATQDGALLARTLEEAGITVMQSTPATWRMLLEAGWSGNPRLKQLCGGEALSGELAERLLDLSETGRGLWNLFGPTETTIWSAVQRVDAVGEPMPIGRPIGNTALYVLDRRGGPVPVGVAGELLIGGAGLARGYLHRGDLTAERFVPNPFAGAGSRLYRTGDLARYRMDGVMEFLGRLDHQVKVRGFRIELGEIEAVLAQHPGVGQAVVVAREDRPGEKRLVAYVTGRSGSLPGSAELWEHLAAKLPGHMLPSGFVVLERLPLTPNGKVDRKALPAPAGSGPAQESLAPRTAVEEVLAGIWAEVLGRAQVGGDDHFFTIGGHSLLATRVVGRVRDALGVELPLRALFERPTLAGQAELVEAARRSGAGLSAPPLTRRSRAAALPLSFAQQRLWFLEQMEPGGAAYNIPAGFRIGGPLNLGALERSLNEVVRRHEVLRTRFEMAEGAPVQIIATHVTLPLPLVDLSGLRGLSGGGDREIERWAALEAEQGFDLTRAPLLRARVLRLGSEDHAVLLTMHHIVSDGWSMGLLVAEVSRLYTAFASGGRSPLPELRIQYADYAQWQREWLLGEVLTRQVAYWQEQLRGLAPLLPLPADRERPAVRSQRGAVEAFTLPEDLAGALAALSRREGATLYMTLLAALQTLLGRYAGEDDIAVGSPVAGRTHRELEGLIGVFVNTLVLRTDLSGSPTVRQLLHRVRGVALEAYTQQDVPFEKLVDELRPERSLGHHPFFQVMLVLQNTPGARLRLPGLTVLPLAGETSAAKFDLLLSLEESAGRLHGVFEYSTDLFDRETVRRLAGHFELLLAAMAADPAVRLQELPLLRGAGRRRVLVEWNSSPAVPLSGGCAHELVAEQARRTPDAVAVSAEEVQLSYGELDRRAGRLARHLRELGVGPEVRVGICAERSLDLVVGVLAILRAGGAYVPLDGSYPEERLRAMIADSEAPVVLVQAALIPRLAPLAGEARVVRLAAAEPAAEAAGGDGRALPEHPAYAIFTSGSTGRPKAAVISHRSIVNRLLWGQSVFGLGPGDRLLQKTPFSFDVSVPELLGPLIVGARLVMARPGGHQDPSYLVETIVAEGITTVHFVPSMLQVFLDEPEAARCRSLRRVMASGEALTPELVRRFDTRLGGPLGVALHNLYGPTEAAVEVTHWPCVAADVRGRAAVPIGRPIAGTLIYLLDRSGGPVPLGVSGELHIGGAGLARGYLNRPELTAEKFVPNPLAAEEEPAEPGSRLYRTGDLARHRPDGQVEFLGRLDHQVKVRGFRIELGEIEAALTGHLESEVAQAVVVVREDRPGEKRLVAYVVGKEGARPEVAALRGLVAAKLPEHMMPAWFVVMEHLPLTANGKLDRKALPAPATSAASAADRAGDTVPRTAVERMLAEIWVAVLGLERVGIDDSFFEVGGDSILCMQVIARAREAGYRLTLKQIFQHRTIAELANVAEPVTQSAVSQEAVTGAVPLTPIQRWFFAQALPEPHHFNQAVLLALREPADAAALADAVLALVRHHDALRLRYEPEGEGWRQWSAGEDVAGVFAQVDLTCAADWRRALEEDASRAQASLALTAGPLLRVVHYRLGPAAGHGERLLLVVHHLAVDGVSWRILLEDLQRAYEQLRAGRRAELPAKTTPFQEWALRLEEHAQSDALAAEAEHWLGAGWEGTWLPVDHPEGESSVKSARGVSVRLERELTRLLLHDVPGVYRTEINDVLLAALAQAVARWTGQSRVLVELEGHGREELFAEVDLSRTVGWFTSLYPVVLDVGDCAEPGEVLKAVKEQMRAIPNRGIGYGLLRYLRQDELGARTRELPPAEIRFNYLGQFDQVLTESGVFAFAAESSGESQGGEGRRGVLLEVNGMVVDGCLQLDWTYSETVHRRETVEALARSFLRALQDLIEHCLAPDAGGYTPSDFPLAGLDQGALQRIAALIAGD
jgi:amino acid adenylation domain-containing protein/non-ribosomal peptide synthase protein (TIGR01720 family)